MENENDYAGNWSEGETVKPLNAESTAIIEAAAADNAAAATEYVDAHKEFEAK